MRESNAHSAVRALQSPPSHPYGLVLTRLRTYRTAVTPDDASTRSVVI